MTQNNTQAALEYLNLTNCYHHLSSSIIKILIKDRRTVHAECINYSQNLFILHAGDIVMVRTAIQRDLPKNKIAKLSYSVRDPY